MKNIFIIVLIMVLLGTGCTSDTNKVQTMTPVPLKPTATIPTTSIQTVVPSTPSMTVSAPTPTTQDSFPIVQCLDIETSALNNFSYDDAIVLRDYYNIRTLYTMTLSNSDMKKVTVEDSLLYPFVSPNRKTLAYLDISDVNKSQLKLVNNRMEIQTTITWLGDWGFLGGWINDNQLYISPYGQNQVVVFDPFAEKTKEMAFNQLPEFNFILHDYWMQFDPTLKRVIYPKGGALSLLDLESGQSLADLPNDVQPLSVNVSWTIDGEFAAVISSNSLLTGVSSDELYVVNRNGSVTQVTDLRNYYGKGVSLYSPSWSPDGRHIALWETDSTNNYQDRKLLVVDLSTKKVTDFCISTYHDIYGNFGEPLPAPIWSPDGTQLLIEVRYTKDHNNIVLLDFAKNVAIKIAEDARPIGWMIYP